jgi:diguanylate cyclase (GGDEF)-like protein/PAS domain S-box-containing protein
MPSPSGPAAHNAMPSGGAGPEAVQDRDKLCQLADSAPVMMAYFDGPRQLCTYANRTFVQGLCDPERTHLGRALGDVLAPELTQQLSPALAGTLLDGEALTLEQPLRLRSGQPLWVEMTLTPHLDPQGRRSGVYVLIVDQSRHHAAERALLESEERLSKFLQAGVEGIFFHRDGHIADANPALCELVGLSLHDLLGRPALMLIAPEHQTYTVRQLDALQDVTFETAVVHQDGTRIPVEVIDRGTVQHGEPMRMAVVRDIRDRHATQARLHYLVHHDALTGLPNRAAFLAQLDHLMVAARASDTQLALLFIDLDHFKRVNDSVGHTRGDALLKTTAQRLCQCVRSTDRVARFGGDEFMVLLPGVRDRDAVVRVAGKLLDAVGAPVTVEGQSISVTPSIGIALYPQDGDTPDVLIKHADTAMHVAKGRGRATFAFFEQEVATSAYDQLMLEGELGHAITHDEFALLFQPQVRARDGHPVGVEALIRWQHPQRGLLAPNEFIALAEQHRLIVPIGAWVLREAARQARLWHAAGWPLTVAVNLSTLQFQAPDFVASIQALLAETGLPAGWLELELTERMLMDDVPQVCARLQQLRALGVKLSVDDFGTGYSSLSHLKELPIDTMKIDRSFVQELPHQRESAAIASAIVQLARGLGLGVVAEGVETEAQRTFLIDQGCDQLQGLIISAPLTVPQMQRWLDAQPALRPDQPP